MTVLRTDAERLRWIDFLLSQSLPLEVESKRYRRSRSSEQNRLLWKMYQPIGEAMGFDRDDLHEWFCGKYWGWRDVKVPRTPWNPDGWASVPVRTTTRDENGKRSLMDKAEFAKFVDLVERTAAQAGVYVVPEWVEEEAQRRAA